MIAQAHQKMKQMESLPKERSRKRVVILAAALKSEDVKEPKQVTSQQLKIVMLIQPEVVVLKRLKAVRLEEEEVTNRKLEVVVISKFPAVLFSKQVVLLKGMLLSVYNKIYLLISY